MLLVRGMVSGNTFERRRAGAHGLRLAFALCLAWGARGPASADARDARPTDRASVPPPAAALPFSLPVDRDRDGLLDADDACPRSPRGAVVDDEGCLAFAPDASSIPFAPGSGWLAPEADRRLARALRTLERFPNARLEVSARTSLAGSAGAVALPLRRVGAVVEWFAARGVPATRIDVVAVTAKGGAAVAPSRPTVELTLLR